MTKKLVALPSASVDVVVALVNGYGTQTRAAAGEQDDPYPDVGPQLVVDGQPLRARDLATVADELWAVIAAPTRSEQASRLNHVLRGSGLVPSVDDRGRLAWESSTGGRRQRLAGACAITLLDLVQAHGWERLGVCSATDCVDVYLDVVGRGGRQYCSTTCLNRSRLRAYRARQKR